MKAIIISDADARALLSKLELTKLRNDGHFSNLNAEVDQIHRIFHFIVTKWLQEQGADCVDR